MEMLILTINPGSTTTKLGLYNKKAEIKKMNIDHDINELKEFDQISDQLEFRYNYILDFLENEDIELINISAIVGRGGLLRPIAGGTYRVNEEMKKDLNEGARG